MNKTTCPNGMVDTCCENYDNCTLSYHDKDAEIKRLNEKIEFLARTNMLYSDWEHRDTQVTSELIRKGIEEHKINAELRAEIERLKQRPWVGLTKEEIAEFDTWHDNREEEVGWCNPSEIVAYIEAKLRSKNNE